MVDAAAKVRFIREQIVLPDGRTVGEAMSADPWIERDLLGPAFALTDEGLPLFTLVDNELARGQWKSGGAAAIGTAEAVPNGTATGGTAADGKRPPPTKRTPADLAFEKMCRNYDEMLRCQLALRALIGCTVTGHKDGRGRRIRFKVTELTYDDASNLSGVSNANHTQSLWISEIESIDALPDPEPTTA